MIRGSAERFSNSPPCKGGPGWVRASARRKRVNSRSAKTAYDEASSLVIGYTHPLIPSLAGRGDRLLTAPQSGIVSNAVSPSGITTQSGLSRTKIASIGLKCAGSSSEPA